MSEAVEIKTKPDIQKILSTALRGVSQVPEDVRAAIVHQMFVKRVLDRLGDADLAARKAIEG
jgi:hypothetical protein